MSDKNPKQTCSDAECKCSSQVDRRSFLALTGTIAGATAFSGLPVMAGPFGDTSDRDNPIPLDKKLDASWIKSLSERGGPTTYSGWDELKYIGMPIGGIAAGTVYLGGDGKLWCWDIFNEHHEGCVPNQIANEPGLSPYANVVRERDGSNYVRPTEEQASPWTFDQGFVLKVDGQNHSLDRFGFSDITFKGQYPIGDVTYADDDCPINVALEAFSPFIPLDVERSSFPATVMRFVLTNKSSSQQTASITGFMANPVLTRSKAIDGVQRLMHFDPAGFLGTVQSLQAKPDLTEPREEILFDDFEREDWGEWTTEGEAFTGGPFPVGLTRKSGQSSSGHAGKRIVNSYNTRLQGGADNFTGTLTSPEFTVERRYVTVAIAGGSRNDDAYAEVLVGGKSVGRVTGHGNNVLRNKSIDVSAFEGQKAQVRIVDNAQGAWGQIAVDHIVFSDTRAETGGSYQDRPDFGSVSLTAPGQADAKVGFWNVEGQAFQAIALEAEPRTETPKDVAGAVEVTVDLAPGESKEVAFVVAWHFPNTHLQGRKRWYATKFTDAGSVAKAISSQLDELTRVTRLWRDTWYGGTLPNWLLERSIVTVDTLQTNNCYRFDDGQFWAWEGVGCCEGTCTHVWHYAQAVGRLFPELERDLRERTDFGLGFRESDGRIGFRGNRGGRDATDGQAGVILRTYREHQVSSDDTFLKRVWPQCKKALEFLVAQDARDGEPDGIPVGEQHNTLDAEWFGKVPVLASLYLASLRAGEEMAKVVDDEDSASRYRTIHQRGQKSILSIYNEEFGYFVQEEDPEHLDAIGVGDGCYIDQVMGQWWSFNLGLGQLYDGKAIRSSLNKLWDYNFCPDMGRLRDSIKNPGLRGRPYALAGDAGLVMCTWPNGGKRDDWEKHWQYGYFNECMTGFEYEAAGHMVWESNEDPALLEKGLAITRSIHDRYHGSMRNPYNEIECSDHYARAMASYGVFLAATGFEYDGPARHIGFAPRMSPDNFSAPFTAAEGWGTYEQLVVDDKLTACLTIKWGKLVLATIRLSSSQTVRKARIDGESVKFEQDGERVVVTLANRKILAENDRLEIVLE